MSYITDNEIAQFHEQGYFVTSPAFAPEALEAVDREFSRLWADFIKEAEERGDPQGIEIAKLRAFIGQAHTRSEVLADFVKEDVYLEACLKLIGLDADLYYNQVVIKAPEQGKPFGWHQDSAYTTTVPLAYITCWTAIRKSTIDNGCIWLIPGSHKHGVVPHAPSAASSLDAVHVDETDAIPVEMEAGQVAIFSSLLLHKSGPNTSSGPRFGYVPQYHVPTVVIESTGDPFGDLYPVLRGGHRA